LEIWSSSYYRDVFFADAEGFVGPLQSELACCKPLAPWLTRLLSDCMKGILVLAMSVLLDQSSTEDALMASQER